MKVFVAKTNRNLDKEIGNKALSYLSSALQFQENMPQVYWQMSFIYGYNLLQQDSAEYYADKATTLVPSWQLPYAGLVFLYSDKIRNYSKAKFYLDKINQIDSNSLVAHYSAGVYYETQGSFELATFHYKRHWKLIPHLFMRIQIWVIFTLTLGIFQKLNPNTSVPLHWMHPILWLMEILELSII